MRLRPVTTHTRATLSEHTFFLLGILLLAGCAPRHTGPWNMAEIKQTPAADWTPIEENGPPGFTYYLPGDNFSNVATGNADASRIEAVNYSPMGDFGDVSSRDFDGDGDVDADDFDLLEACFTGPNVPIDTATQPQCRPCDLDHDLDLDGADYALFQICMSGENIPAAPTCVGTAPVQGSLAMHGLIVDVIPGNATVPDKVLLYARARHYDPNHGRWLQRDPLGHVDGPNLYEAFRGNPLRYTDADGTLVIIKTEDAQAAIDFVKALPQAFTEKLLIPFARAVHTANRGRPITLSNLADAIIVEIPARQIAAREASIAGLEGRPIDYAFFHSFENWMLFFTGHNAMVDGLNRFDLTTQTPLDTVDSVSLFCGGYSQFTGVLLLPEAVGGTAGTVNRYVAQMAPGRTGQLFTSDLGTFIRPVNPSYPPRGVRGPVGAANWVEEPLGMGPEAARYSAGAAGARSNLISRLPEVPQLGYRRLDGSLQVVRFDGLEGAVLIDRKLAITTFPKTYEQALRQSTALLEHRLLGRWEVPTAAQAARAQQILDSLGITNITVKVVPR